MKSADINKKLLELVPNLKGLFETITEPLEGIETGSTIVVEDVLMDYLQMCLDNKSVIEVSKCSAFIEWMAENTNDDYVANVFVICVLERIRYSDDRKELENVLGPKALAEYLSMEWPK